MPYFPMFTDIKNKKCLIVGGGNVAKRKADNLLKFGAEVYVVAKELKFDFSGCKTYEREFKNSDIDNSFIVVAATDSREVNHYIAELCNKNGINVNVADSGAESSFIFGASIIDDNMVVSVNSGENNPKKSKEIKECIMNYLDNKTIRIGTRKSKLAKTQVNIVIDLLKSIDSTINCQIVELITTGDKNLDKSLTEFGGKGAFTGEFEAALLNDEIDIAVHSGKDLPIELAEGLEIIATPKREKANDVLIKLKNKKLDENSIIGTSSIRRKMQIKYNSKDIRGNVDTRLSKMENGEYDGIVLAYAGLKRLGVENIDKYDYTIYDTDEFYPAPCQGIIAIEAKKDSRFNKLIKNINDMDTFYCFQAERQLLKELGLGCQMPLGAYSYIDNDDIVLKAVYLCDNSKYYEVRDKKENAITLAKKLAENIKR